MVDTHHLALLLQKRSPPPHHHAPERPAAAPPAALLPTHTPAPPPRLSADGEIAAHRKKYARFFAMLRVGIPRETVEQAMRLAGIDPVELDGPHIVVDIAPASAAALLPCALTAAAAATTMDAGRGSAPRGRKKALRKRLNWDVKTRGGDSAPSGIWSTARLSGGVRAAAVSRESMVVLEKLFEKEAIAPAHGARGFAPKKAPRVAILETKKAQNIAIILARVKLSVPQLIRELVGMNPTVLCAAQLQGLLDMWPDRKELEAIGDFSGDVSSLGEAEQLFAGFRSVPRVREKLACLIFKQEFPLRVHELRESIRLVIRGVNQVCSSLALQQLFAFVLQIGNLLNFGAGSARAATVAGFALSSLERVAQTKAFVGGITLLQFVVQAVDARRGALLPSRGARGLTLPCCGQRDCAHLADFHKEIGLLSKCSSVSIRSLVAEQQTLEAGWRALVHEAHAADSGVGDGEAETGMVSSILLQFAAEVETELEAIQELLLQLEASKQRFLQHFDERDATDELDELLRHIARFTEEFVRQHRRLPDIKQAVDRAVASGASRTRSAAATA